MLYATTNNDSSSGTWIASAFMPETGSKFCGLGDTEAEALAELEDNVMRYFAWARDNEYTHIFNYRDRKFQPMPLSNPLDYEEN